MKIIRRCPICGRKSSMNIDKWCVENKKYHAMGVIASNFYQHGECETCQKICYKARLELEKMDNDN